MDTDLFLESPFSDISTLEDVNINQALYKCFNLITYLQSGYFTLNKKCQFMFVLSADDTPLVSV